MRKNIYSDLSKTLGLAKHRNRFAFFTLSLLEIEIKSGGFSAH